MHDSLASFPGSPREGGYGRVVIIEHGLIPGQVKGVAFLHVVSIPSLEYLITLFYFILKGWP